MSANIRLDTLHDFGRHGFHIHLTCANGRCDHHGVVEAHLACRYFILMRFTTVIEAGALTHFYCTRCGAKAGRARPTVAEPTVTRFFPADERGWKLLQRRLRG